VVNAFDYAVLTSHLSKDDGGVELTGAFRFAADLNGDGRTNSLDQTILLSFLTGARDLYEGLRIAVENGFVGTESEWLESLRAPAPAPAYWYAPDYENVIYDIPYYNLKSSSLVKYYDFTIPGNGFIVVQLYSDGAVTYQNDVYISLCKSGLGVYDKCVSFQLTGDFMDYVSDLIPVYTDSLTKCRVNFYAPGTYADQLVAQVDFIPLKAVAV